MSCVAVSSAGNPRPRLSCTIILKPPTAPMPRTGGGEMVMMRASSITASRLRISASRSRPAKVHHDVKAEHVVIGALRRLDVACGDVADNTPDLHSVRSPIRCAVSLGGGLAPNTLRPPYWCERA